MHEISVVIAAPYGNRYLPMIKALGNGICCCYGIGFPRRYKYTDEPLDKMKLTKLTTRISSFIVKPTVRLLHLRDYYTYFSNIVLFDSLVCNRVANDASRIVFLNPLLCKTAEKCKKKGKLVICEAGNSEPNREYARIKAEYERYKIKHQYIYGDPRYKDRVNRSYNVADKIITISQVSNQTYLDASFPQTRLQLISMAGTDLPVRDPQNENEKLRAFISTSVHNFLKGTQRLLLAWKSAGIRDVPLIIVGRLCDDIKEFVARYGPFENVVFAGYQKDLWGLYQKYDAVGILMSLSEGAVRVTPEMMSFGFPMITSPDATCDIVKNGMNGFIVSPQDENGLAERMKWFAEDWNRVHAMQHNVLSSVIHRTIKDYSLELGEYLQSTLENTKKQ